MNKSREERMNGLMKACLMEWMINKKIKRWKDKWKNNRMNALCIVE